MSDDSFAAIYQRWSAAMLEQARRAGGDLVDVRLGDMRELELDEPAALICCPFRSLLHLPTWGDCRRVFERVAAWLGLLDVAGLEVEALCGGFRGEPFTDESREYVSIAGSPRGGVPRGGRA